MTSTAFRKETFPDYNFTNHAVSRMSSRAVSANEIDLVMAFGRVIHIRSAEYHVIGHREVAQYRKRGVNLDRCEGIHVVFSSDGAIITVYPKP